MDEIKEAFQKVKQDISSLSYELNSLKTNLVELNWKLSNLGEEVRELKDLNRELISISSKILQNSTFLTPSHSLENKTTSTQSPADNESFKALKPQNQAISIGNDGVPADRQTDQQTDQQTQNSLIFPLEIPKTTLHDASKILESLDTLKKEIRLKFKKLTEKEILVFSTLYQLEEEQGYADYKAIALKLNLTESSIRDYISKIISKGIPVDKIKLNNKNVHLNVSAGLKKIASLQTILKLREL
ncbi:MAG: hypothetical protein AABW51_00945 [Nanoarchaeota archaeon]